MHRGEGPTSTVSGDPDLTMLVIGKMHQVAWEKVEERKEKAKKEKERKGRRNQAGGTIQLQKTQKKRSQMLAMRAAGRTGGVAAIGPSAADMRSTSQGIPSMAGRAPVELVLTPSTAIGVDGSARSISRDERERMGALLASPNPGQFGCRLVWGMSRGFLYPGLSRLLKYAKPIASEEAFTKSAGLFPIPVDFSQVKSWAWPLDDFSKDQCEVAWVLLSAAALNDFYGLSPPYPTQRRGRVVEKCLQTIRGRVRRFLLQSVDSDISFSSVWEDVSKKQINYEGEEVAVAQMLTLDQVFKSLPPLGHGGSVELAPLLQGRTRFLIENPEQVLLPSPPLQKVRNSAKVHIAKGEEVALFRLLFERGVIDFVPEKEVYSDVNGPFLSGLFGVPKPNKFSSKGAPVLRLIMNLIPINRTLDVILGDIAELPSASCWQQLVLLEGDSISISQADMASAFYLFRLPVAWQKYLCFNHRLTRKDVGLLPEALKRRAQSAGVHPADIKVSCEIWRSSSSSLTSNMATAVAKSVIW